MLSTSNTGVSLKYFLTLPTSSIFLSAYILRFIVELLSPIVFHSFVVREWVYVGKLLSTTIFPEKVSDAHKVYIPSKGAVGLNLSAIHETILIKR